ncbi:MAG TPA: sigma-70 family RNA polymerase sigma factor [Thermoanaerobaculia bacterium]
MGKEQDPDPAGEVTQLLRRWSAGDGAALEKLLPLVYDELRRRAGAYLRQERPGHTLQPTALVHEAYLKLVGGSSIDWKDRAHFFGVAARVMRQVLVDHARARNTAKRGEGQILVGLDAAEAAAATPARRLDLLDLDRALSRLAALDERQSRLVELRLFAGLTIEESAEVLRISHATVSREWKHAEAWLQREMAGLP